MLLSSVNYTWAKKFLTSSAFSLFDDPNGSIRFSVPTTCPANGQSLCLTEIISDQMTKEEGQKGQEGASMEKKDAKPTKSTPKKRGCPLFLTRM